VAAQNSHLAIQSSADRTPLRYKEVRLEAERCRATEITSSEDFPVDTPALDLKSDGAERAFHGWHSAGVLLAHRFRVIRAHSGR
jgi:hypothetical protein